VLRVHSLNAKIPDKQFLLGPLDFEIREGEIFGIGGLLGSGRTELVKAIFGDESSQILSGQVSFLNEPVSFPSPGAALKGGISYVSEDRKGESILPMRSLNENARISNLAVFYKKLKIDETLESQRSGDRLKELNTKCTGINQEIQQLSGGNQQKVIIARAMETDSKLIILDEPTRGIDVKAKSEIYEIIFKLALSGKAILLISSDLPELMALSDRVAMMREGQIKGILDRSQFTQFELMRLAFGA
ncbi:MAG: sugar ABC transporter ATP-binding protein, partial [Bdellovibrionales bacterium]|nr:sugar ABC transporter ATP-binding protein [Bdellovibrionales bacterium]